MKSRTYPVEDPLRPSSTGSAWALSWSTGRACLVLNAVNYSLDLCYGCIYIYSYIHTMFFDEKGLLWVAEIRVLKINLY